MSKRKSYTAQEMREAADFFMRNSELVRRKVLSNSVLANIHDSTAMLRQAAEMRDELKAKLAAAERCIEEIESVMSVSVISECAEGEKVNGIIRAYREAKEAK